MSSYDLLDETGIDENPLGPYARKKARQAGWWMGITAVAGLLLFGSAFVLLLFDTNIDDVEEITIAVFFIAMVIKYALLLVSAVQTRKGAVSTRSHLLFKAAFHYHVLWVFVGILALVFLLQVFLYFTTGYQMFGEITHDMLNIYW